MYVCLCKNVREAEFQDLSHDILGLRKPSDMRWDLINPAAENVRRR